MPDPFGITLKCPQCGAPLTLPDARPAGAPAEWHHADGRSRRFSRATLGLNGGWPEAMISDDQPIKVYDGELADVVFLRSLMAEARIEVVSAGLFFGPAKEIFVTRIV